MSKRASGRALKVVVQLSESIRLRDTTPRLYGSNIFSMRQPSVRAKSEHGGDGSFAKVFAALLVHLDGAQGNAGAAGQPGLAESGAHADRVQPGVASVRLWAARSSYTSTNRLSSASCRVGCSRTISSSHSTSRMSENRTPLPIGSMRVPIRPSIPVLSGAQCGWRHIENARPTGLPHDFGHQLLAGHATHVFGRASPEKRGRLGGGEEVHE